MTLEWNDDRNAAKDADVPKMDTQYRRIGAYQIAVHRIGKGQSLLLLHGTPAYSYIWRQIAAELGQYFCVYLYDMLGYGESDKAIDDDVHLAVQAQLCVDMIRELEIQEPLVAAHDFGGAVALRVHLLHQIPFRKLMLLDVVAMPGWGTPFAQLVREYHHVFRHIPQHMAEPMIRAYIETAMCNPRQEVLDAYMKPWQGDVGRAAFFNQIAQFDQTYTDEFVPLLPAISIPVHIVWGEQDQWLPAAQSMLLSEQIPGATCTRIPNAGHFVQEDQPARVIDEMKRFFVQ
ncbi:alpha/beta fold hydrolase [Paenibacillus sp. WLX1005]|uniref:alpha/beta fold hydrolase n=1 Tax=Paenibacillus sp. WLX1005 TaxID=3243766 RepID=UPI0039845650